MEAPVLRWRVAASARARNSDEELETITTIERANTVQLSDDAIAVVGGGELHQAALRVR